MQVYFIKHYFFSEFTNPLLDVPHVALLDFLGENDHELSIKQGDILHVINRGLSGWLKVIDSEYKSGWVPESFLVHVSQSQLSDTQQTVEVILLAM